jgi:hypothetical protein
MNQLLSIDHLRSLGIAPKWFGLGFIQLKLHATQRMHFWHPELRPDDPAFDEEYHDHRYDFTSDVLVGEISNVLASVEPTADATDYSLFEVCCSGGGQEYMSPVRLNPAGTFTTVAGSSYFLQRDTFHRVSVERCVTRQTRYENAKAKARVVQRRDRPSANPFETHMSEARVWEYIEDLLPVAPKPGYHLAPIAKGVLGEPSKILEEVHELIDAVAQDARVMELVELSDLMGAVEAFLQKRHPGYTLDDLMTFSAITKRAFVNGHRS